MTTTTTVLGSQWGDEGKGKLVDVLCQQMDVCARFNGGNNAGHSVKVDGVTYAFHLLPSGVINDDIKLNVIGNGCVVHLPSLFEEIDAMKAKGKHDVEKRLVISDRAHLVLDVHLAIDGHNETGRGKDAIGTTKKGIGPAYAAKAYRSNLRAGDLLDTRDALAKKLRDVLAEARRAFGDAVCGDVDAEVTRYCDALAPRAAPLVRDAIALLHEALAAGRRVMLEGANAAMLDIDFGTYPYVTSSSPTIGGALTGLGLCARQIGDVYGVVKAYTTRVGGGPFPTELAPPDAVGVHLQAVGAEFGTTTGRARRCGWLDLVVVAYTHQLNGYTALNLTKLDVLTGLATLRLGVAYEVDGVRLPAASMPARLDVLERVSVVYETLEGWTEDISACRSFDALPAAAQRYVRRVESFVGVPVRWIGVGAGRDAMIVLP